MAITYDMMDMQLWNHVTQCRQVQLVRLEQLSQQKYRDMHQQLSRQRERLGQAEVAAESRSWQQWFPSSRERLGDGL